MTLFYRFGRWLWTTYLRVTHKVTFRGVENIPQEGGYILCSNHRTVMDPAYIAWKVPQQLSFMAKKELFETPVVGFLIRRLEAFPVERGKGDTGAVDYAIQVVEQKGVLAMFPEGTRSKDGQLLKGKSGVAVIAAKSGGGVLPVGIKFQEPIRFRSRVEVRYGRMIQNEDLKIEDNRPSDIKLAAKRIMSEIAALLED